MYPEDTALFATVADRDGCKINIPVVCQKCGKCCFKLSHVLFDGEEIDVEGIERTKDYLGMRYYEIVDELRKEFRDALDESYNSIIVNPCPFLKEDGCEVYPARPKSCREFPVYGDQGVGCPALERFERVLEYVEGEIIPYCIDWKDIDHYKVKPSPRQVVKFLSMAEEKEVTYFLSLNEIGQENRLKGE